MIEIQNKNLAVLCVRDGGITKPFSSSHNGCDWGWVNVAYDDVYAIQEGIVREAGYEGVSSGIGWYVTLEHNYADSTKRITGYIHLKEKPLVSVGEKVKAGQKIGVRGGSPYQSNGSQLYGTHLHLYVTKPITVNYSWNNMKNNVVDPMKELTWTRMKGVKYNLAKQDGYNLGETTKYYEDLLFVDPHISQIEALQEEIVRLNNSIEDYKKTLSMASNELEEANNKAFTLLKDKEVYEARVKTLTSEKESAEDKLSKIANIVKG